MPKKQRETVQLKAAVYIKLKVGFKKKDTFSGTISRDKK